MSLTRLSLLLLSASAAVLVPIGLTAGPDAPTPDPTTVATAQVASLARVQSAALRPTTPSVRKPQPVHAMPVTTKAASPAPVVARAAAPRTVSRKATAPAPVAAKAKAAESLDARRDRVLDSLNYDWESLGYRVVFAAPRRGYLGLTSFRTQTITLYIRSSASDQDLRVTLAHEIGHVVDHERGTTAERAAYLKARGASGTAWYPCNGCSDYASGAGDFAEVFAVWLAGPTDYRSQVASRPTRAQAAALVGLLD